MASKSLRYGNSGAQAVLKRKVVTTFLNPIFSPPRFKPGTKISFRPRRKQHRVVGINRDVRERKAERRRAADHLTLGVVLRAVARALELVLSLVPGDDATQVRAHRVQTKVRERPILLDDQVSGVTLQALRERVVARQVRLEPRRLLDVVTVRILRGLTGTTATGAVVRISSDTQSVTCSVVVGLYYYEKCGNCHVYESRREFGSPPPPLGG